MDGKKMAQTTDSVARKNSSVSQDRILSSPVTKKMKAMLNTLVDELLLHDGFGKIEVDMKILSRRQKEFIIRCGKEYRFVMDFMNDNARTENFAECQDRQGCPYGVRGQEQ